VQLGHDHDMHKRNDHSNLRDESLLRPQQSRAYIYGVVACLRSSGGWDRDLRAQCGAGDIQRAPQRDRLLPIGSPVSTLHK
jgi:hypothetical protein